MGCTSPKQSTGAATLEMNMLRNVATSMLASNTQWGFLPTRLRIAVAMDFAMKCLLRAPAIAKPPSNSMMTCKCRSHCVTAGINLKVVEDSGAC